VIKQKVTRPIYHARGRTHAYYNNDFKGKLLRLWE